MHLSTTSFSTDTTPVAHDLLSNHSTKKATKKATKRTEMKNTKTPTPTPAPTSNLKNKVDLIIDLQYGSTGKGLIAGYLALKNGYDTVVNANMPNAGHTFIDNEGNKMIHKVLPNGVVSPNCKQAMLGAGSVFSVSQLRKELAHLEGLGHTGFNVVIHCNAVILQNLHREAEQSLSAIGSTAQGSGAALMHKIARDVDNNPTVKAAPELLKGLQERFPSRISIADPSQWWCYLANSTRILAEGAQGFSLGISERFYPYCTSRDCTPARFLADMSIPLPMLNKVIGTARVHPIRVGGTSGDCYPDQTETSWKALGLPEELTTVTQRVRRVFSFSADQIMDALAATCPDEVFLNFVNYDEDEGLKVASHINAAGKALQLSSQLVCYYGFGAKNSDVLTAAQVDDCLKIAPVTLSQPSVDAFAFTQMAINQMVDSLTSGE